MSAADNIAPKPRISNKTFRLRKPYKRLLALLPFADAETRSAFKNSMIGAQVASSVVFKGKENRPS